MDKSKEYFYQTLNEDGTKTFSVIDEKEFDELTTQEQVQATIQSLYNLGFVMITGELIFFDPATGESAKSVVFGKKDDVEMYNFLLNMQNEKMKLSAKIEKEELDGE